MSLLYAAIFLILVQDIKDRVIYGPFDYLWTHFLIFRFLVSHCCFRMILLLEENLHLLDFCFICNPFFNM